MVDILNKLDNPAEAGVYGIPSLTLNILLWYLLDVIDKSNSIAEVNPVCLVNELLGLSLNILPG